jgi:hypothetical protein
MLYTRMLASRFWTLFFGAFAHILEVYNRATSLTFQGQGETMKTLVLANIKEYKKSNFQSSGSTKTKPVQTGGIFSSADLADCEITIHRTLEGQDCVRTFAPGDLSREQTEDFVLELRRCQGMPMDTVENRKIPLGI